MPRLLFDLVNGVGTAPGPQRREVADSQEARTVALAAIRSILAEDAREGLVDLRGRIDVRDACGQTPLSFGFDEAVEVLTGPAPEEAEE